VLSNTRFEGSIPLNLAIIFEKLINDPESSLSTKILRSLVNSKFMEKIEEYLKTL
jgi:hypothetical protein